MPTQTTSNILMVRPVRFGFNEQTAESNAFQNADVAARTIANSQNEALNEFDAMVYQLRSNGVNVMVFDDTAEPHTPDSIFPNNWVSFHQSGKVILYPMQAANRRLERRQDIIETLSHDFQVTQLIDLSYFETENKFLEGTGSMVLDRQSRIAYACLSPRTNLEVLTAFSKTIDYKIVTFDATDINNKAIYHTNVVMCVGDVFVVICLEAIKNLDERLALRRAIEKSGKEVIEISLDQMNHFAGNMLLVNNAKGEKLLAMSTSAYQSLTAKQINKLGDYARLIHFDLSMIEGNGGGSARCMMAEVHLPRR